MAELRLSAAPRLGGVDKEIGGNRIRERADLALVSVAVPLGGEEALTAALASAYGLAMPEARRSVTAGEMRAMRTTADQLMLIFADEAPDAARKVNAALDGAGYTTDQTDAWVRLEVSGPTVCRALERLCPIDLDPAAFPVDAAARTVMEHMGAVILRSGEDSYLLMSASSSAESFLHAVETSFHYTA